MLYINFVNDFLYYLSLSYQSLNVSPVSNIKINIEKYYKNIYILKNI